MTAELLEERVNELEHEVARLNERQTKIIKLLILFSLASTTAFIVLLLGFISSELEKAKMVFEFLQLFGFGGLIAGLVQSNKLSEWLRKQL